MTSAPTNLDSARAEVVQYAQRLTSDGLVVGTSGNISLRVDDLIAVTPSGVDYATMTPEDIPVVRLDCTVVAGSLKNRVQTAAAKVLAERVTASMTGAMSKPGSGSG